MFHTFTWRPAVALFGGVDPRGSSLSGPSIARRLQDPDGAGLRHGMILLACKNPADEVVVSSDSISKSHDRNVIPMDRYLKKKMARKPGCSELKGVVDHLTGRLGDTVAASPNLPKNWVISYLGHRYGHSTRLMQ